jgi:hypothetical protein
MTMNHIEARAERDFEALEDDLFAALREVAAKIVAEPNDLMVHQYCGNIEIICDTISDAYCKKLDDSDNPWEIIKDCMICRDRLEQEMKSVADAVAGRRMTK